MATIPFGPANNAWAGPMWNNSPTPQNLIPPTAPTSGALPPYNVNPAPTPGQGPYGLVPGTIGIPPSIYQQTTGALPGLGSAGPQVSQNILNELSGQLDPAAINNIQDIAARFGVSSGMPGSNAIRGTLGFNKQLRDVGLDTLAVKRQGQQDYLSALQGVGSQQLSPDLLARIAQENALLKSAPDPEAAANRLRNDYLNALNRARGPAGGTGGSPFDQNPAQGTGTTPFVGGTPSGPQFPPGYIPGETEADVWRSIGVDPSGFGAKQSTTGYDSSDLLNELFGQGPYAPTGGTPFYDQTGGFGGDLGQGSQFDNLLSLDNTNYNNPDYFDPNFYQIGGG